MYVLERRLLSVQAQGDKVVKMLFVTDIQQLL
jgi:hypothetical protein